MTTFTLQAASSNYAAKVIEVKRLVPLEGLDNLVGLPIDGLQALVSKDTQVGDILVVFPVESKIEDWFLSAHNLYSHAEKNVDTTVSGYVGDNQRVRAIKLRKHTSNALAMSASIVGATAEDVGTLFDTVDGVLLLQKYEVPVKPGTGKGNQVATNKFKAINLPVHYDTENWWRNEFKISDDTLVTVSQKLHGTSARFGRILVDGEPLSWWKRLLGHTVSQRHAFVVGSRKVIKSVSGESKRGDHFYSDGDVWTNAVSQYEDVIPDGFVVFGELIGWTGEESPIQKGYTYDVPKGQNRLVVYRVAVQSPDGLLVDLSWDGVRQFALERGFEVVPTLWQGRKRDFVAEEWLDKVYSEHYTQAIPLSDKGTVDEGVVIRAEGITSYALKAKSPIFLGHETRLLDEGVEVLS